MSNLVPTYVRKDGEVLAFFENRVIASGADFTKVENTALAYLESLGTDRKKKDEDKKKKSATHIITPSGERGQILSNVDGLWGEKEVTIRTEKGRIVKLAAHGGNDKDFQYVNEPKTAASSSNPIEALRAELDEEYPHLQGSMEDRLAALDQIITNAANHVRMGATHSDEQSLDKIVTEAKLETAEINSALAHMKQADAEAFAPPAPYDIHPVEQADMGRAKGDDWLDHTVNDMLSESEGQNFDKILAEEPAQLTAELEDGALANQGVTGEIALSHIMAKTAGFVGDEVEAYREQFVAATEIARRAELADRQASEAKRVTAKEDETPIEDESLFM